MSTPITDQWMTAQQAVIGSVVIDAKKADAVLSQTRPTDYTGVYREIYLIVQELMRTGVQIDPVTILGRMQAGDGSARRLITELIDTTPTSAHCQAYIDVLIEQSKLHQIRTLSMELAGCTDLSAAAGMTAKMSEILASSVRKKAWSMGDLLNQFYERHNSDTPVSYLPWGIRKLDTRLFAELGDYVILGGYPSSGKTAMALSFAWAQSEGYKVGFFSLETREYKLFDRQVSMITGIPMPRIKRNRMTEADWKTMSVDGRTIYGRKMDVIPAAGMTATEVMQYAKARGYQIIYIDYIQLLRTESQRAARFEHVTEISITLHVLANQYGITVVGLSQLRRADRASRAAPTMSDLRESGQLEQDADIILLLYQTNPDNPEITDRDLKIAKNKEGEARAVIPLDFDGSTQRFTLRRPGGTLTERVHAAERELAAEANQMRMLDGPDEELPFI